MQLWLNPNRNRPRRRPRNPTNSRTRTRTRRRTNRICVRIDKARAVWLNLCPLRGRLPKWPTGADCKSAGYAFDGSNPSPTTTFIMFNNCNDIMLLQHNPNAFGITLSHNKFNPVQGCSRLFTVSFLLGNSPLLLCYELVTEILSVTSPALTARALGVFPDSKNFSLPAQNLWPPDSLR